MNLTPLHNPENGQMHVVGLMSGSGSNLQKILEREHIIIRSGAYSPYKVVAIFTDNADSNAFAIGKEFDIPVVLRDKRGFYKARGKKTSDISIRPDYDAEVVKALAPYKATVAAYAGYMTITSPVLVREYLGVNVHPGDLSILGPDRKPVYTGAHPVRDALFAKETHIRSTTHLITEEVDCGNILMRSRRVAVNLPGNWDPEDADLVRQMEDEHQTLLKLNGDHLIFPQTLINLAEGRYTRDNIGNLYFEREAIPSGLEYTT
jgi:phosphoribosylglycinamide formyltransferase 1